MKNAIAIQNLTKRYGKHRGVEGISLQVPEGDIFGFLGPNGAGKSTTIRCLLGMLHFQEGEVEMLGKTAPRQQRQILQETGYLPSEVMFYPSMRAEEVIRFAARVRGRDCSKEAERLCRKLEVDMHKRISELSLGNRKKIGIVCAMQHNPGILILDEPTSGLDPLMQEVFFEILMEYNSRGTTCFLSSHVLPEVKKYCKNAGIIKDGRLVRVDTVEKLTKSNLRKVKLIGVFKLPELTGVRDMIVEEDGLSFSYTGGAEGLLNTLQNLPVQDILIEEPSLEEIFMHFYTEEGGKKDDTVQTGM